jgi:hypothetical protein
LGAILATGGVPVPDRVAPGLASGPALDEIARVDFFKLGLLVPLLPLFLVPLFLVGAAWMDRRRHARRGRAAQAAASAGPVAIDARTAPADPHPSSQPRSRPSDA